MRQTEIDTEKNTDWLQTQWGTSPGGVNDIRNDADKMQIKIENGLLHVLSNQAITKATASDVTGRNYSLKQVGDNIFEMPQQLHFCIMTFTTDDGRTISIKQIIQ